MFAFRLGSGQEVTPFGGPVGALPVLGSPLSTVQEAALGAAGFVPREVPPDGALPEEALAGDAPYLLYSDRTWFSADFLRAIPRDAPGRVTVTDAAFLRQTGSLQPPFEVAVARGPLPALSFFQSPFFQSPAFQALPPLPVDLQLRDLEGAPLHPAFRHADLGPTRVGTRLVHGITHWSHLLRANLLALAAGGEETRLGYVSGPLWRRLGVIAATLWRAKSLSATKIGRAVGRVHPSAKVHETAVIEGSIVGPGVEVGAFAVLRGAVVGEGARIEDYAQAQLSVVGAGARLGSGAMLKYCVLFPGAFVSAGEGFQMSVFGEGCFVAQGVTVLDLSFGEPIPVRLPNGTPEGEKVSSGAWFLGAAIGPRARLGSGVRVGYGVEVPADAVVVARGDDLLRRWGPGEGVRVVREGVAVPSHPPLRADTLRG